MDFEYDPAKSDSNKVKHGIDFIEAQLLWRDPKSVEIRARTEDEPRFLIVGKINGRFWSAVVTYRNERCRIISVRRSRDSEVMVYESV